MSADRASRGGGWWPPKRGSRRGGSAPSRGSPTTPRGPRPVIKPGLEDANTNAWAAFANNPRERDAQRTAQRQEEEARITAERISQGLPAESNTEISETQTIRGQDGSTTTESRTISTNEQPAAPAVPLANVEHQSEPAETLTTKSDVLMPANLLHVSSSEPIQRTTGNEPVSRLIGTTEEIPMLPEPKTQSLPSAQQPNDDNDYQRARIMSSNSHRSEQELQPTFTQSSIGYSIQEDDIMPPQNQPQEQRSPSEEERSKLEKLHSLSEAEPSLLEDEHLWPEGKLSLPEIQGDAVELPVDQTFEDKGTSHGSGAETRPSYNGSESDIVSDDELDRAGKGKDIESNVSHDKVGVDIIGDAITAENQDIADSNKLQYKTAYGQSKALSEALETAGNALASPPRSISSSDGASGQTERPPQLESRMGEVIKAIGENYKRLNQLSRVSSEQTTSIDQEMTWPPDETLFGTSAKPKPQNLKDSEFKDSVSSDAVRPLNIVKPASEEGLLRKTVYSQLPQAKRTKNGPNVGHNISSIANNWRQEDHSLQSFLPKQFQGPPSRVSSSLHGSTAGNMIPRSGYSKHWILDGLTKLCRWIKQHPILFTILLIGPVLLAKFAPMFDRDSFFKKPLTWTEELLPLENTSLLRAVEAESALQHAVHEVIVSPRKNDSISRTQHSCGRFVKAQINDAWFIYKSEQTTLAFIYKKMVSDLQTTIFQHNVTLQDLANIYDKITKASQSLTNIDRQISQHIKTQRINSHQCVDAPGSTVKAHGERTNTVLGPRGNVSAFFDPVLIWIRQFPALLWLLPDKTLAQHSPTGSTEPDSHLHADNLPLQHATPFDNHFRTIERSLLRSQRGHKGLRDELQRLEGELSLLSKSWFTEEQLIPLNILRNWTRRLWHASGEL